MIIEIGKYLLYIAILLAWAVYVMSLRGKSFRSIILVNIVSFLGILISYGIMINILQGQDYTLAIVYNYTSLEMTAFERLSAAWVARASIMTLWGLYMVMISVLTTRFVRKEFDDPVVQNMLKLTYFFAAIIISFAVSVRPGAFDYLDFVGQAPTNGLGLMPSLLSIWNLIHPPLAFLGYSAFIVPFAAGIAILNAKRKKIKVSARIYYLIDFFMLLGWCLNSILLLAGSLWGYEENWSGFWAWDPVEIASLVMWAGASLYFHTKSVVEPEHPLRAFTATLGWLGVAFASFIVRSGILSGLHSYTSSAQAYVFGTMLFASITYVAVIVKKSGLTILPDHLFEIRKSTKKTSLLTFWLIMLLVVSNVIGLTMQIFNAVFTDNTNIPYWYYIPLNMVLLLLLAVLLPLCVIKWKNIIAKPQLYYTIGFLVVSVLFFILSEMTSIILLVVSALIMTVLLLQIQETIKAIKNKNKMKKIGRYLVHIATLLLILSYMSANFNSLSVDIDAEQGEKITIEEFEIMIHVERIISTNNSRIEIEVYDLDDNLLDTLALTDGFYKNKYWSRGDYMITSMYDIFFHINEDSFSFLTNAPIGLKINKVSNVNIFRFSFFAVVVISIIAIVAMSRRKIEEVPVISLKME